MFHFLARTADGRQLRIEASGDYAPFNNAVKRATDEAGLVSSGHRIGITYAPLQNPNTGELVCFVISSGGKITYKAHPLGRDGLPGVVDAGLTQIIDLAEGPLFDSTATAFLRKRAAAARSV